MIDLRPLTEENLSDGQRFFLKLYAAYRSIINPKRKENGLEKRRRKMNEERLAPLKAELDQFLRNFPAVKLNLGCGDVVMPGWINIDRRDDVPNIDINYDLSQPLPFRDDTVDFIFNEHFLEHLSPAEGLVFLKECKRCLKPGGVLRVAMPHIKPVVDRYYNNDVESDWARQMGVQTKAELVNIGFKYWGHQWLYDEAELERRLKEAGFEKIEHKPINQSTYPELRNLETRIGSELIYEAVK